MPDSSVSIAQHYHERTKYDPVTIAHKAQSLNWDTQPSPFKNYKIGTPIDLKPYLQDKQEQPFDANHYEWRRLSRLLLCSYGITVKVLTVAGDPIYLRAAPSAGGLYPAELYLISRGTPLLPAGLYNYQSQTHSLLRFWDDNVWPALQDACFWHPVLDQTQIALVTTAVFVRSAWRYQARAYRRIFLDTGHLLGNIELASAVNDYRPHLIGGFADDAVNEMLYLNSDQEGAIAIIPLADLLDINQNLPLAPTALPSRVYLDYPDIAEDALLTSCHQATKISLSDDVSWKPHPVERQSSSSTALDSIEMAETAAVEDKYNFPFCLKISMAIAPISWDEHLLKLESMILKRRSTRAYSGANLMLDDLKAILDFTYQPEHYLSQGLDRTPDYFDLNLIETFVAVSGVDGLDEGCYYYAPKAEELRQIRFKNFRRELHFLCLKQDLGRDAAALIFHTADLTKAIERYGDRAYRYLHMDAGHLGQRLNLSAVRLGVGVCGIAGFFDNQVNEVLGIPPDEAVLYITTLGRARR
jgi:SagB-type dehydrogenase family enzyme